MVGTPIVLARIPVIKFRKGGVGRPSAPLAAAKPVSAISAAVAAAPTPAAQAVAAATASTVAAPPASPELGKVEHPSCQSSSHFISSKQLPKRLRRAPLTDDEIDSINEGGAAAATAAAEISNRAAALTAAAESAATV